MEVWHAPQDVENGRRRRRTRAHAGDLHRSVAFDFPLAQWIYDAVNGILEDHGLELLP